MRHRPRTGFTLVELLTVIAIIALVIQMLLPAVQAAREAARRTQCTHHMRQLALGAAAHEGSHRFFPSGGWGYRWIGDPDRGFGKDQPGGWIYNILPYVEQESLRGLGKGLEGAEKESALRRLAVTPLSLAICPSRRAVNVHPYAGSHDIFNCPGVRFAAKTDYAVNVGSKVKYEHHGPTSVKAAYDGTYDWPRTDMNGVGYQRSEVRAADITDGLSSTILLGEKHVHRNKYTMGTDKGDNETLYSGLNTDHSRSTNRDLPPLRDHTKEEPLRFGSAHASGCNFVFCDGSARTISYDVTPSVYELLGSRDDGKPVDQGELQP